MSSKKQLISRQTATEVADGVYWFADNGVNWYVIEDDAELTVVDAGLPTHWDLLQDGLDAIGYDRDDIQALVLTHSDVDHIGFAERLRQHGVPVWVHVTEHEDALAGGRSMPPRVLRHLWRPSVMKIMITQVRAGAFSVQELRDVQTFEDGERLDVPGELFVIHVPGHTVGQCSFWLEDREILFCGDTLFTVDVLTGRGCEPASGRFSEADVDQAKRSTRVLAEYGGVTLLPGHGRPWSGNLGSVLAS